MVSPEMTGIVKGVESPAATALLPPSAPGCASPPAHFHTNNVPPQLFLVNAFSFFTTQLGDPRLQEACPDFP